MIPRPLVTPAAPHGAKSGFSLIEVTLAIGLLAFCLIPLMGLLPTGLNAQHNATEGALAADALTMLSTAVHSSQFVSRVNGTATYRLPKYLTDIASQPSDAPTIYNSLTYTSGNGPTNYVYFVMDDGSIRKSGDKRQPRLTMYLKVSPPWSDSDFVSGSSQSGGSPSAAVRVYALLAWPSLPADTSTTTLAQLKNRQGYVESYITYVPN